MRDKILNLKKQGKSHNEIATILGCSKASVSYHCSESVRNTYKAARSRNRKRIKNELKMQYGGKCKLCSYNKSLSALDFHHKDPKKKQGGVAYLVIQKGKAAATKEAKKCILVCSNCHHEIHDGLIIPEFA